MKGDTIPLLPTLAETFIDLTSGQPCIQIGLSSATCNSAGTTATAVVTNGQGGMASVFLGSSYVGASATVEYSFGIEGQVTQSIPIIISGHTSTQDGQAPFSFGYADYEIFQGSAAGENYVEEYFGSPNACAFYSAQLGVSCLPTGNFSISASITSNSVFVVSLAAGADGMNEFSMIDPTITIDPSFADASEFTLVSNPGVFTPTTPITAPEPTPAGLLALSLAALAFGGRKRMVRR